MARTSNLTDFLNDVAAAIKTKKGYESSQKIQASEFDTEILSISTINNQNKSVTPSTSSQTVEADQGYTGLGTVTVGAVTASIDQNITTGNIKSGVTILGVQGSLAPIPDGIFIQESQPTKTTSEALWLKEENTNIPLLDQVPNDFPLYFGNQGWKTFEYLETFLTQERIEAINAKNYLVIESKNSSGSTFALHAFDSYSIQSDLEHIDITDGITMFWNGGSVSYLTASGTVTDADLLAATESNEYWSSEDLTYNGAVVVAKSAVESGIHVDVDDKRYIVHQSKSGTNTFTKILDTSDADAVAADIVQGKTAYVNNVKVTGSLVVEDLSATVTAQEAIIAQLQAAVQNKTGGPASLNVYAQTTEPTDKDGLWLKSNVDIDHIITDSDVFGGEEWDTDKMANVTSIPYNFYDTTGGAIIGNEVYLFGGQDTQNIAYKYNILTDTYTQLTNVPVNFYAGTVTCAGTDCYLFGGISGVYPQTYAYKYDTLTDTYTQLRNLPGDMYQGSAAVIGDNIYITGGQSRKTTLWRYSISTNSYQTMSNIPFSFYLGSMVAIGTDLYLFGSHYSSDRRNAWKYDTLTGTYTQLTNIPYDFYWGEAQAVETNIYLFGGQANPSKVCKYNTITGTYSNVEDLPAQFIDGSSVFTGTEIYLFGGNENKTTVQILSVTPKEYQNKSLIIIENSSTNKYQTELIPTNVTNGLAYSFDNFYYYTTAGGLNPFIEKYVGDGTTWNKIN